MRVCSFAIQVALNTTSEVGNGFCREMLLPCSNQVNPIKRQCQAPLHSSALLKCIL